MNKLGYSDERENKIDDKIEKPSEQTFLFKQRKNDDDNQSKEELEVSQVSIEDGIMQMAA